VHAVRELMAFQRVYIEPGQTKKVEFVLPSNSLAFFDSQERRILPSGRFELYVGSDSLAPLAGEFVVTK
jgi:hypothetical protein